MLCEICGSGFTNGDSVAKIVHATYATEASLIYRYELIKDEGVVHINCLKNQINQPEHTESVPAVERTNILEFLDK